MSQWPSVKARGVLAALLRIGWSIKRQSGGSHKILERVGWADYIFAFHDNSEVGPRMLPRIAKQPGWPQLTCSRKSNLTSPFNRRCVSAKALDTPYSFSRCSAEMTRGLPDFPEDEDDAPLAPEIPAPELPPLALRRSEEPSWN